MFGDEVNKQLKVSAIKEQSLRRKNTKINIVRRKFAYGKRKSNGSEKSQPHTAYIVFIKGCKLKFTYFMRTIDSFEDYVDPIQEAIDDLLLPTLFGQSEPLPNEVRLLVTLTTAQGGLGMPDLRAEAPQQLAAWKTITTARVDSIKSQSTFMAPGESFTEELKRHHQSLKRARDEEKMEGINSTLSPDLLRLVNQSRDKGASSWLNAMPLADQGLALNKQEIRVLLEQDSI